MTEKEKAYAGLLHDASDPELAAERAKAKKLCTKYNRLKPLKVKKRKKLIKKLFGEIGKHSLVEQPFYCDYGNHIKAGKNFFVNFNCVMLDVAGITFGDNVLIAPNCGFYTVGHPFSIEQRCSCLETAGPIVVGNNVWIGGNTAVMPGVTIGDNTVIGAGSVVTKSVPANKLAYGNPCRVIRELTEEELGFKK